MFYFALVLIYFIYACESNFGRCVFLYSSTLNNIEYSRGFFVRLYVTSYFTADAGDELKIIQDDFWAMKMRERPEAATYYGIHDYNDQVESFDTTSFTRRRVSSHGKRKMYQNDVFMILNDLCRRRTTSTMQLV